MNTPPGVLELLALSEKATPGPWEWRNRHGQIEIAAPHGGGTVVMGFVRDGHRNGQPVFGVSLDGAPRGRCGGILRSAKDLIAEDPDGELTHPDALFMVAAANFVRANAESLTAPPPRASLSGEDGGDRVDALVKAAKSARALLWSSNKSTDTPSSHVYRAVDALDAALAKFPPTPGESK